MALKQRAQARQNMLNQPKAGRLWSLSVRVECQARVAEGSLEVPGNFWEGIYHVAMVCVHDGRIRGP